MGARDEVIGLGSSAPPANQRERHFSPVKFRLQFSGLIRSDQTLCSLLALFPTQQPLLTLVATWLGQHTFSWCRLRRNTRAAGLREPRNRRTTPQRSRRAWSGCIKY